ncbi:hypothetical protein C2G38_2058885 [Gigaspora rosea]|uniref:Uncharacterized protein n=1 Tax=Gigaspora rosea TaxID=44941 RepID=A0A397W8I8_9GLOM|nr:hypothetical protein C2G38_2058885 [Gigaspora rosea]
MSESLINTCNIRYTFRYTRYQIRVYVLVHTQIRTQIFQIISDIVCTYKLTNYVTVTAYVYPICAYKLRICVCAYI